LQDNKKKEYEECELFPCSKQWSQLPINPSRRSKINFNKRILNRKGLPNHVSGQVHRSLHCTRTKSCFKLILRDIWLSVARNVDFQRQMSQRRYENGNVNQLSDYKFKAWVVTKSK
jgi:hypothetical protein